MSNRHPFVLRTAASLSAFGLILGLLSGFAAPCLGQAAFDKVRSSGSPFSTVYFPPGTYRITREIYPERPENPGSRYVPMHIRGHGRSSRIVWDGAVGGRMFRSYSASFSTYIGIAWDGQGTAAEGFIHAGDSESKVTHQHAAFMNFTEIGCGTNDVRYLESSEWRNCLFVNCGKGLASDTYIKQMGFHNWSQGPYVSLAGSSTLPEGRVTMSSPKLGGGNHGGPYPSYETYYTVDNYRGRLSCVASFHFNAPWMKEQPPKKAFRYVCSGEAPLDLLLMANDYQRVQPSIEGGENVTRNLLGNWLGGLSNQSRPIPDVIHANTMHLASQPLDDFRELGELDLELNHPGVHDCSNRQSLRHTKPRWHSNRRRQLKERKTP